MSQTYVTIAGRAVGNDTDGFHIEYGWDGRQFTDKGDAVSNGCRTYGCDDFNIGVVRDGALVSLWWMDHQLQQDSASLARIGREIGL